MKLGDILTCYNAKLLPDNEVGPPLKEGNDYSLKDIHVCECGQAHYDVGLVSEYAYISCYKCKTQLPKGTTIHWCHPDRFNQPK